ncbi:M56 family metallopeptidase [Pseudoflavitalea sp. X16]|uniref:M56 family metallopeptidase n=1 Tax=Paraflavitalea devenefica TaxID=2716334 RepID=UPI00142062A3|nr:M56 family metallopeptidase [Paraflavitalea devenefica]NII27547.1 M56 family metallopeptidase [Paraflavitalea devenefica]
MITYIIKATVCSILLLLVYRFLLQREKMYAFNRGYLLFSILFSLLVPFITFEVKPDSIVPEDIPLPLVITLEETAPAQPVTTEKGLSLLQAGMIVYVLITGILLTRFLLNLYRIRQAIAGNNVLPYQGARLVLTNHDIPAHSFLHYIFISQADYNNPGTRTVLLTHELSHIRQKHSWDVLFIELLLVFCWLNPAWIFYKRSIQLNHELQADDTVIKTHPDIRSYQHLLLEKIQQQPAVSPASSFNYFITKKRLTMMTKAPNSKRIVCLQLALLPLFLAAVVLFSERTYAQEKKAPAKKVPEKVAPEGEAQDTTPLKRKPIILSLEKTLPPGPGASAEQLNEFKQLVDKGATPEGKVISYRYSKEDKQKLKAIYADMSDQQRREFPAVIFSKPPVRKSPTTAQLQSWGDAAMYGVWIDSKRISNAELASHKPEDFALYYESRLAKNAVNYGKHYVQVDLYTQESYNRMYTEGEESVYVIKKVDLKVRAKKK